MDSKKWERAVLLPEEAKGLKMHLNHEDELHRPIRSQEILA